MRDFLNLLVILLFLFYNMIGDYMKLDNVNYKNINFKDVKKIYMIGIGGVSMSGIALILQKWGYEVLGSDFANTVLRNKGILVNDKQVAENITSDIDLIVYTAAISEDNPELVEAKKQNIPLMERGEFLGIITRMYKNTIGIAGTHGKTTTTSMISCIFLEANLDPTIQVGSYLSNISGNYRIGHSENFILESCEYKDSFLYFKEKSGVVLNIDTDHLDYFKNLDNIKASFYKYVSGLDKDGFLVYNADDENSKELVNHTKAKGVSFGILNDAAFMADKISYDDEGYASFELLYNKKFLANISLSVPGKQNVYDALAAIALSYSYNIKINDIVNGLKNYHGAARRLEFKGYFKGAKVYDDYGHHPTEVKAVANAVRNKKYNKSFVVFEPHTYSRVINHKSEFAESLKNFDKIIVTDIYAAREKNINNVTSKDIVIELEKIGKDALYISSYDDIIDYLKENVEKDDIIVTLGAGNVTKLSDLLTKLVII